MRVSASIGLALVGLALLGLVSACDRPTPVAPAESTLTITANPTRIAVDGSAVISVLARKSDGTAVNEGTEINFATTLGTIDPLVTTDQRGVAEATLRGDGTIGMAIVTVNSGAAGSATIEIQVGALATSISLNADPRSINKDLPAGGQQITLTARVRDDLNNAVVGVSVVFESDIGSLASAGPVKTDDDGVAIDTLTVTQVGNVTDGFFEVSAATTGEGGGDVIDFVEINVGGFAANITLSAQPASLPATGGTVRLIALVRDDFGDELPGAGVNFITPVGTLASEGALVDTDINGQAFDNLFVSIGDLSALVGSQFTVTAEVAGAGGVLLDPGLVSIAVQSAPPNASFIFSGGAGFVVTYSSSSTGDAPLTLEWDFESDGIIDAVGPTALKDFGVAGTFTTSLTATDSLGRSDVFAITIDVPVSAGPPPVSNFNAAAPSGSSTVTFSNLSTGDAPLSYLWDFGDGTTSTATNPPPKLYTLAGNYPVKLTVTDPIMRVTSSTQMITIPWP